MGAGSLSIGSGDKRLAVFASFEFDLETLELKKQGVRLRLEHKPARALVCLLQHPGTLIDRAHIIKALWPGESHGDFDHRLNKAVNKLRSTLGDDSSQPRFIQTLPRRGYRFVAQVTAIESSSAIRNDPTAADAAGPTADCATPATADKVVGPPVIAARLPEVCSTSWWRTISLPAAITLATAVMFVITGFGAKLWSVVSQVNSQRCIVVVGFQNLSGNPSDAWLSIALADWLTADLSAGDQLRAIPMENVARGQRGHGDTVGDLLSPEILSRIRKEVGADLVLSGSFATLSGAARENFRLDLHLQEARSGTILQSLTLEGSRSEALQIVSQAGIKLRSALHLEPLSQIRGRVYTPFPANADAARDIRPVFPARLIAVTGAAVTSEEY